MGTYFKSKIYFCITHSRLETIKLTIQNKKPRQELWRTSTLFNSYRYDVADRMVQRIREKEFGFPEHDGPSIQIFRLRELKNRSGKKDFWFNFVILKLISSNCLDYSNFRMVTLAYQHHSKKCLLIIGKLMYNVRFSFLNFISRRASFHFSW